MVRFHLTREDLLRTRFAISPLFEAVSSRLVLRGTPDALHEPWVRAAAARGAGAPLKLLDALLPTTGSYVPDFLSPPPATHSPTFAAELERLARTSTADVRREVGRRYADEPPPRVARAFLADPAAGLARLAAELTTHWEAAVAPWWDAVRGLCGDDIARRASALVVDGPIAAFDDLGAGVTWDGGDLLVPARDDDARVTPAGRGLQLVPSAFVWPRAVAVHDPPWQPSVIYPPRGIGALWAPVRPTRGADDAPLARLLGPRRAAVLAALGSERTAAEVAGLVGASPQSASDHLAVLRDAGLVRTRRAGREARSLRTPAGDALLAAAQASPSSSRSVPPA